MTATEYYIRLRSHAIGYSSASRNEVVLHSNNLVLFHFGDGKTHCPLKFFGTLLRCNMTRE